MSVVDEQITLFTATARTATPTAATFSSHGHRALHLVIYVSAISDTPSVTPTLAFKDEESAQWCTLLVGAAITATGITVLKIGPGIEPAVNAAAADYAHGNMRLSMAHGDSDSITYSAAVHLM